MDIRCGLENETYKYIYGSRKGYGVPFKEDGELSVTCARNDYAAVQLLLWSEKEMLVSVNDEPCFYEGGTIDNIRIKVRILGIADENLKIHLIGLVEDDDRQLKSDILLEQPFIHVEPRKVQPVWIEVKLDKNIPKGVYRPEIIILGRRLFEDEEVIKTLPYTIKVIDYILDEPARYSFYLDLWQHNSNIARKYDVELWSDRHFEIMENYVASLADLGQKAITVLASDIPWSGQHCFETRNYLSNLYEYSMVSTIYTADGRWEYDFSAMNRYISLCMKHGIKEEIEVFGLINIWMNDAAGFGKVIADYPDGIRVRYYDQKAGAYKYMKQKSQLELYIKALEKNCKDMGWIDKVRIVADEPSDTELYKQRLNELRKMAPSFKFKAAINHIEFIEEDIEGITDYVPILPCVLKEHEKTRQIKDKVAGRLLYYVCCWPDIPNTFIASPLVESRIIPWLAWYLGLDGFLRWNYTVWPERPLDRISYRYPEWKAGDTNFVYPGKSGKPLLTLRYKSLKKGIRDFEIFRRYIEFKGSEAALKEKVERVFFWKDACELHPDMKKNRQELYSLNQDDYEKVMEELLIEMENAGCREQY